MDNSVMYFILGYIACCLFSAFTAGVDYLNVRIDNKFYFRKIIKKILERIDSNA